LENDEKVIARISVSTLLKRIEGKSRPEGVRIVEGRIVPGNTVRFRGDC
jgi:translation initiation factor IF-1